MQRPNQVNQVGQPNTQLPDVLQSRNHGGHELFDAHEIIDGMISILDHYQLYEQHVKDDELREILQRQYSFVTTMYDTVVHSFQTGQDPMIPTQQYRMKQTNHVVYGMKPSEPRSPNQSVNELSDQGVSSYMLGQTKSLASLLTMTALEMTNPVLRRVVADSVPNFIEQSYEIFLYQNKHGYYQVPQLSEQDMGVMLQSYIPVQQQEPLQ
ncbi:spore coat protein [Bacillus sp. NTK071]|uniref:spore coat protein n=1 Tax=Bacillus sp. NTK071 TaxID=2802175 RepID=UPI001A8F3976|nr:spore coat protein [Bacillus sp. NTK071]MBN8211003.1 spore coat protein [Bacillus sp. NTK071]